MLDNQQRVLSFQSHEKLCSFAGFLRRHSGGGLIHQHQCRILSEHQRDLEPLRLSVGEIRRGALEFVLQIDKLSKFLRAFCGLFVTGTEDIL
ncbi:hypothetical protein D9M72_467550 [compost metagenome]